VQDLILIMQSASASCNFLFLRSEYEFSSALCSRTQSALSECARLSFTPIQNNR